MTWSRLWNVLSLAVSLGWTAVDLERASLAGVVAWGMLSLYWTHVVVTDWSKAKA